MLTLNRANLITLNLDGIFARNGDGATSSRFLTQVIRRKNPAASQIVYQDELQIALLPSNGWKRKGAVKSRICSRNSVP